MSVIHIAGFPVLIGRHGRQRCAWCGEMLFEVFGDEMAPMKPDGSLPDPMKPWETGELIEVHSGPGFRGCAVVPHEDGTDLPANACVGPTRLLPRLTVIPGGA